jgi:hypothetical protein
MADILGIVTALACALFAGAAVYISVVEHPARLSCGTEIAARQWAPSYKRATAMQVSLALLATLGGVSRWLQGAGSLWLGGAVTIVAVIPFTLIVILPTNNRLLESGRDLASSETRGLLEVWGRLHAVRSALSLLACVLFLVALTRGPRQHVPEPLKKAIGAAFVTVGLFSSSSMAQPSNSQPSPIIELRYYSLRPGQRDVLIELFEREFIERQEALGMSILGTFRDLDRPDHFVWVRGFRDMASRAASAIQSADSGRDWRRNRHLWGPVLEKADREGMEHWNRRVAKEPPRR